MIVNKYQSILLILLGAFMGCEDNKPEAELQEEAIIVTTENVNVSNFYYDIVNNLKTDSTTAWHLSIQTFGQYNMPSVIMGTVYVAVYRDLKYEDITEAPTTFMEDYAVNNSVYGYQGDQEILNYDMTVHRVSVADPENVYILYDPSKNKTFKIQFIEYNSGITVFKFNQL